MKAAVLLSLLGLLVKGQESSWDKIKLNFDWNSLFPETNDDTGSSRDVQTPNNNRVCQADQAACGCCLMQQQIERLKSNFKESLHELNQTLIKATENLEQFRSDRTAFSVALSQSDYGPFRDEKIIFYDHVFLNFGNHYNPSNGIFLVPRTGVYNMALTVYSDAKGPGNTLKACASLRVNGNVLFTPREFYLQDQEDSATVSMVLLLKQGDKMWVTLPTGCFLHDDGSHYNTYSVFMLYSTDKNAV